jgi:spore coat polysaccharide biosynthesis protein SpsF
MNIDMEDKKVVTIIQARMTSSRLPGKVLAQLGHLPVLSWMLLRTRRARLIDQVMVATTTDPSDDDIVALCEECGTEVYRGSMHDVLDRYYQAARQVQADVIVRLTADCPFIDPVMLDDNIRTFLEADPPLDFAANRLPLDRTVPIGLDTELCTFQALETAWRETKDAHYREHVMPYFYEHPERFNILHIRHEPDYGHLRWTVDTPEDLDFLREVVRYFPERYDFSWLDVLFLVQNHPELSRINAEIQHKTHLDVDDRQ